MSSFDHDAAMQHGAKCQQKLRELERKIHVLVEDVSGDSNSKAVLFLIAKTLIEASAPLELFRSISKNGEHEVNVQMMLMLEEVKDNALSNAERKWMLLHLGMTALQSATSHIVGDFSRWESEHFQEGVKEGS